jgi:hypothetical protein
MLLDFRTTVQRRDRGRVGNRFYGGGGNWVRLDDFSVGIDLRAHTGQIGPFTTRLRWN